MKGRVEGCHTPLKNGIWDIYYLRLLEVKKEMLLILTSWKDWRKR